MSADKKPFSYASAASASAPREKQSMHNQQQFLDTDTETQLRIPLVDKSASSPKPSSPASPSHAADQPAPSNPLHSPPSSARSMSPSSGGGGGGVRPVSAGAPWPNSRLPHKKSSGDASPSNTPPGLHQTQQHPHLQQNPQLQDIDWKAVGSPPRRQSVSFPQTPDYRSNTLANQFSGMHLGGGNNGNSATGGGRYTPDSNHGGVPQIETSVYEHDEGADDGNDDDDLVLSRKRNIRTRTASTPNAMMGVPNSFLGNFGDGSGGNGNENNLLLNPNAGYGGNGNWSTGGSPSIWNGNGSEANSPSNMQKQFRSLSFSLDVQQQQQQQQIQLQKQQYADLQRRSSFVDETNAYQPPSRSRTPLLGVMDHSNQDDFGFQNAGRSRSKSSGATYGLPDSSFLPQGSSGHGSNSAAFDPMNSIWANNNGDSAILHRRSSTQPGTMDGRWGGGADGPAREMLREDDDFLGIPNDPDKYRRRHSHAPHMYDLSAQMMPRQPTEQPDLYDGRRRHSMAGPPIYSNYLNDVDALYDIKGDVPLFEEINDYFENTDHRTKAWVEAGKNLQKQSSYTQQHWPVYVVEFKAGRIDYFHAADAHGQMIRSGDLVIVEADRGKDLGKVIHDNLANLAQLHMFQSQHKDIMVESLISSKEIQPKRIYGLAQSNEIALLVSKAQDEAKAMAVCQAKIRQRKLPMEIVDAEYQWDRKKLTFYFVADRRVDFRELIRDLFKLYKTRIWMCAVDPSKMPTNRAF